MKSFLLGHKKIKAVIFDMDGVITDTMPYHFRAWRSVFARRGLKLSKFAVYRREGQKGTESIQEIFSEYGRDITVFEAKSIIAEKEALFKRIVKQRYVPGARSLLKKLYKLSVRLALVTGTARHEVEHMLPSDILSMFSVVVTGTDVNNGKPHPEPYLKALHNLEIDPRQSIVIENAPYGIKSAKAAGLTCCAITTSLPKKYLIEADIICSGHVELTALLMRGLTKNE